MMSSSKGTSFGQDVAVTVGTICLLEVLKFAFGWRIAVAVGATSLIYCIAFLWFAGEQSAASVDTHAKRGDSTQIEAPSLMGSAVAVEDGQTP
jgi:hypothetical protein